MSRSGGLDRLILLLKEAESRWFETAVELVQKDLNVEIAAAIVNHRHQFRCV